MQMTVDSLPYACILTKKEDEVVISNIEGQVATMLEYVVDNEWDAFNTLRYRSHCLRCEVIPHSAMVFIDRGSHIERRRVVRSVIKEGRLVLQDDAGDIHSTDANHVGLDTKVETNITDDMIIFC